MSAELASFVELASPNHGVFSPERQSLLAARILAGERHAENELAHVFERQVLRLMRARTRDVEAARDLTQDTLLAVLLALRAGQLREGEKLAAYVQGTARNILNRFFRSRMRMPVPLSAELAVGDSERDLVSAERTRLLFASLASVSRTDRQIVYWSLVDGLTPGEIADRLGMSAEVVRCRKCRALKRIAERLRFRIGLLPGE